MVAAMKAFKVRPKPIDVEAWGHRHAQESAEPGEQAADRERQYGQAADREAAHGGSLRSEAKASSPRPQRALRNHTAVTTVSTSAKTMRMARWGITRTCPQCQGFALM